MQSFCICFSFFNIVFKNMLTIPLLIRNIRLILTLTNLSGVPVTVAYEQRDTPLLAPDKTNKAFSS